MICREAFEQTEHCLDEKLGANGLYIDTATAMNWLIWLVSWAVTTWNLEEA